MRAYVTIRGVSPVSCALFSDSVRAQLIARMKSRGIRSSQWCELNNVSKGSHEPETKRIQIQQLLESWSDLTKTERKKLMATATTEKTNGTNTKKHQAGDVPRDLKSTAVLDAGGEVIKAEVIDPKRYLPKIVSMLLTIRGVTPLIVENFNKKVRDQLLAKHKGEAVGKRAAKDVDDLFVGSKYLDENGVDCFPCGPIRAAIIGATRLTDTEKMTTLKQTIFVEHPTDPMRDMLPLEFSRCVQREDATRNANGQPDIRIRASYLDWSLKFKVNAVQNVLSSEQLLELVSHAGLGGLGGWRPAGKKGLGGVFGRFSIASIE